MRSPEYAHCQSPKKQGARGALSWVSGMGVSEPDFLVVRLARRNGRVREVGEHAVDAQAVVGQVFLHGVALVQAGQAARLIAEGEAVHDQDRKSTRLNSSHSQISYAVFCLKKKKK